MNILLLIAHGSRREESNLEIESLVKKITSLNNEEFDSVIHGFHEFASPNIEEANQ